MSYGIKYRIPIYSPGIVGRDDGILYNLLILERDYTGGETNLKGSNSACIIRYTDNDETKYSPIQASEMVINFINEGDFNLEEIITEDDLKYMVQLAIVDQDANTLTYVWHGFLVTDDCFEVMQDYPVQVTLKATDSLGLLKTQVPYSIDVYEYKTVLQIINDCLLQTGLEIDLIVEVNVFEDSMSDRTDDPKNEPLNQVKMHTRSLLKDDSQFYNSYDILERIMNGFLCSLFQQDGAWYIQRKHDRWAGGVDYGTRMKPDLSDPQPVQIDHHINIDGYNVIPITADHLKSFINSVKYSKRTYKYEVPYQLPRNGNFQQGSFIAPLSGPANTATRLAYWKYQKGTLLSPTDITTILPYRNVEIDPVTQVHKEGYIVLPKSVNGVDSIERLVAEPVPVSFMDQIRITGDFRFKNNFSGNGTFSVMKLVLYGYNGNRYTFHYLFGNAQDEKTGWKQQDGQNIQWSFGTDIIMTDWQSFDIPVSGFPADGELYIWFYYIPNPDPLGINETWFKNINFDWKFFISNITAITGETDNISNTGIRKSNFDEEILIGDSPKKVISGALFEMDGFTLTDKWSRQGKTDGVKLLQLNNRALYQSAYRLYTKIDGTYLGVNNGSAIVGPANIFSFPQLKSKRYIPTNLEIDISENTFRALLQEFDDSDQDNEDIVPGTEVLKYNYK